MCVHTEGRNHYVLVGPTATMRNSIVCGAEVLVAADRGQFRIDPIFIITCGHVPEMKRDPDFLFMYALISPMDHTNGGGTVETFA